MITECPNCGGPVQCLTDNEDDRHPLMACAEGSHCPGPAVADRFQALLDARDAARESHENYCASVNEEGSWGILTTGVAERLHLAYLALQAQVDAETETELEEGL